jgi:DNA-binding IclR family transcriptional regulator
MSSISTAVSNESQSEHRIPAVDRAIQLLEYMAQFGKAIGIRELALALDVPRSTVYRLINSLEAGMLVVKATEQTFTLGPALRRLAQAVPLGYDLVTLTRPVLESLASSLRLSAKLSVLEDDAALVVACAIAPTAYSVSTQVGRRFPLHAGAASKVLAAYMNSDALASLLPDQLEALTSQTITDKAHFKQELMLIKSQGFGTDHQEFADGIEAVATPILGPGAQCVAAISVPFFLSETPERKALIREQVMKAAHTISTMIGGV